MGLDNNHGLSERQMANLQRMYPGSVVKSVENGIVRLLTPVGIIQLYEKSLTTVPSGTFTCYRGSDRQRPTRIGGRP